MADGDLILESLDSVPEPLRAFFREEEGHGFKFVKPEDAGALKRKNGELLGLRKREQERREDIERQLNELRARLTVDDEEVDLEALPDLIRTARNGAHTGNGDTRTADTISRAEAAQERKKAVDAENRKLTAEIAARDRQIEKLTEQINRDVLERGLHDYCQDSKLPFKLTDKASRILLNTMKAETPFVVGSDGRWAMRDGVIDDDGAPFDSPQAWLNYQVQQLNLMAPSTGGGATSSGASGATPTLRSKRLEDMNDAEKAQLSREDPEAFKKAVMAKAERDRKAIQQRRVAA